MDANTRAAADSLTSDVRREYINGAQKLGFSMADAEALLEYGLQASLSWAWLPKTDQAKREEKLMRQLGADVTRWATVMRGWADRGRRDDGTAFDWARWLEYGRYLAGNLKSSTGLLMGEAVFERFNQEVVAKTVTDTATVAAKAAEVATDVVAFWDWSLGTKLLVGGVLVVAAAAILRPYVTPLLPRSA